MKLGIYLIAFLLMIDVRAEQNFTIKPSFGAKFHLTAEDKSSRPLSLDATQRLVAFARALALVRYFYPSDAAAVADWDFVAREGVMMAETASTPQAFQAGLEGMFAHYAPGVHLNVTKIEQRPPSEARYLVVERHRGYGQTHDFFQSWRNYIPIDEPIPHYHAVLGLGLELDLPLAVYADAARHTLPLAAPSTSGRYAGALPKYDGDDRATRLANTLQAWGALFHFFPYSDVVAVDWDGLLRVALASAATDSDKKAFTHTLARIASALRDGHARAKGPREADYFSPGLPVRFIDGRAITGPSRLSVPVGSELIAIDGMSVVDRLRIIRQEFTAPSASMQAELDQGELLSGIQGTSLALRFIAPDGHEGSATVTRDTRLSSVVPAPAIEPIVELDRGIWYVDLARASNESIANNIKRLAPAAAIIFDVRSYVESSLSLLGHLTDGPLIGPRIDIARISSPDRSSWEWETQRIKIIPLQPQLKGRFYFLIGGGTISKAETFMEFVRDYKLGTTIGVSTAGTSGEVASIALAGDYKLYWTGMRFLRADGSRYHGIGIAPDVYVGHTRLGFAAGKDEALGVALERARAESHGTNSE